MVPRLPNQFSAIVNQMMVKETAHWREQSVLETGATDNAQKSLKGEAAKIEYFVQEIFEIDFRTSMTTASTLPVCVLCVILGSFLCNCALSQDLCMVAMPCRRAPIHKKNILMLFNHNYNTIMSLKDFDNICIL